MISEIQINADADFYWRGIVRMLLEPVLTKPEALTVESERLPSSLRIIIRADGGSGDEGRAMGKKGRMIRAVEYLVALAGKRSGALITITLLRGESRAVSQAPMDFIPDSSWSKDQAAAEHLAQMANLVLGEYTIKAYPLGDATTLVILAKEQIAPETIEAFNTLMAPWGRRNGRRITVEGARK